ncbi:hypothetical protein MSAN_00760400 [Mycena sanguinolenta]|uniref:Uncharacterized protein n=1 Tax=Mycena sanguinolenta TaxID=230812 RepID=A0A8H7DH60_9AGAR|nr:hypothetical protein MSAN_00760400 [Mycena sanguinolenta]
MKSLRVASQPPRFLYHREDEWTARHREMEAYSFFVSSSGLASAAKASLPAAFAARTLERCFVLYSFPALRADKLDGVRPLLLFKTSGSSRQLFDAAGPRPPRVSRILLAVNTACPSLLPILPFTIPAYFRSRATAPRGECINSRRDTGARQASGYAWASSSHIRRRRRWRSEGRTLCGHEANLLPPSVQYPRPRLYPSHSSIKCAFVHHAAYGLVDGLQSPSTAGHVNSVAMLALSTPIDVYTPAEARRISLLPGIGESAVPI